MKKIIKKAKKKNSENENIMRRKRLYIYKSIKFIFTEIFSNSKILKKKTKNKILI